MAEYRFLPPKRDDLSRQQKLAIDLPDKLILNGVPGTGKTTVSLFRFINNNENKKRTLLFTRGRILNASIRGYISAMDNGNLIRDNIFGYYSWLRDLYINEKDFNISRLDRTSVLDIRNFVDLDKLEKNIHEIIIDEAQDLPETLHKFMQSIYQGKISIGADDCQKLNRNGASLAKMRAIYPDNSEKELTQNYRNTYQIYAFAICFLPDSERVQNESVLSRLMIEKNISSSVPVLYQLSNDNNSTRLNLIKELIKQNPTLNIGIIAHTIDMVHSIGHYLRRENIEHSLYHSGLEEEVKNKELAALKNIIVTTNISSKGLEFDLVILPSLRNPSPNDGKDNYVSSTRAKIGLHVITNTEIPSLFNNQNFRGKYKIEKY